MKPSKVIKKVNGLIEHEYFENPFSPKTCRTCAVGALIQALPEDKFNALMESFIPEEGDEYDQSSKFYNGKMVQMIPVLVNVLGENYSLSYDELLRLQQVNDGYDNTFKDDSRKARVLKYLWSIGK